MRCFRALAGVVCGCVQAFGGSCAFATYPQVEGGAPPVAQVWRSQDILDSIGIVTHVGVCETGFAYCDVSSMIKALQYLGLSNVREALPDLAIGDPRLQRYYQLLQAGFKMSLTADGQPLSTDRTNLDDFVTRFPGQVIAVEGLNEPDIGNDGNSFKYASLAGAAAVAQYQIDLYGMVKADPLLKSLPVWEFSLNSPPWNQVSYEQVYSANPAVIQAFDYANKGVYAGYWSIGWGDRGEINYPYDIGFTGTSFFNGAYEPLVSGKPLIVKETGLLATPTGNARFNIPDYTVQAKLMPDVLLDTLILGSSHTYIYELADFQADPNVANLENHWGLYDNSWNPKPVATMIRNLSAALRDTGANAKTFTPKPLTVSVPQFPIFSPGAADTGSGFTLVSQRSSGTYAIFVWYEPVLWNQASNAELPVPAPIPVTLNLGRTCGKTDLYDPYSDRSVQIGSNTNAITLMLPDHAVIVSCIDPL